MSRVQWLGAEVVEMAPGGGEVHELVPGGLPANEAEVQCLADCAKKHKSIENFDLNAYNACVMACTGQPTGPTKKLPDKPKEGADLPKEPVKTCPAGQILVNGACVPAPAMTPPAPEKKTPWGWIILGGAALLGGAYVLLRGAGELGGAMASNPGRSHLRPTKTWYIVAGRDRGSYSKPFSTRYEAEAHRDSLAGPWQGEGTILEVPGADMTDARARSGAVQRGWLDR